MGEIYLRYGLAERKGEFYRQTRFADVKVPPFVPLCPIARGPSILQFPSLLFPIARVPQFPSCPSPAPRVLCQASPVALSVCVEVLSESRDPPMPVS